MISTQQQALDALMAQAPAAKLAAVAALEHSVNQLGLVGDWQPVGRIEAPGRPDQPALVEPTQVPRRRLGSDEGRAALIHAVAHIEFNAINLALDAMVRFAGMPADFYTDWLSVAVDEARHYQLLEERLAQLGRAYGDFDAHNGLWEMAVKTDHDVLIRMALVPRVLEARGLDVTPGMIDRLVKAGDQATVEVLKVILHEEERHVDIGSRWFRYCCEQQGLDPNPTFRELMKAHAMARLKGPFNYPARSRAGFDDEELDWLASLS